MFPLGSGVSRPSLAMLPGIHAMLPICSDQTDSDQEAKSPNDVRLEILCCLGKTPPDTKFRSRTKALLVNLHEENKKNEKTKPLLCVKATE